MFSTACVVNNKLLAMADDYERLLQAAKELQSLNTPTEIARFIGEYDQMMTNWKSRGIPKGKVIDISNKIGCNHFWLRDGTGNMADDSKHHIFSSTSNTAKQTVPLYLNYQSLLEDLAELPVEDVEIFKQKIKLAVLEERKKKREKSDLGLTTKSLDSPSKVRRTA